VNLIISSTSIGEVHRNGLGWLISNFSINNDGAATIKHGDLILDHQNDERLASRHLTQQTSDFTRFMAIYGKHSQGNPSFSYRT